VDLADVVPDRLLRHDQSRHDLSFPRPCRQQAQHLVRALRRRLRQLLPFCQCAELVDQPRGQRRLDRRATLVAALGVIFSDT
jgi:hypothetical protein